MFGHVSRVAEGHVWTEPLTLGVPLPTLPLWLNVELCVPLGLEESYAAACVALRIPA